MERPETRMFFRSFLLFAGLAQFLPAVTVDRAANDAARFLAGLPGTDGSGFKALESDPAWIEHKEKMDAAFGKETDRQAKQKDFHATYVAPNIKARNCFYPFGGADTWNVYTFFPKCEQYMMIGLEPPGTMAFADSFQQNKGVMATKLANFRGSLGSVLSNSFFITAEMDRDYRGQKTDGLLIPLMALLVRHDVTIEKVQYLSLLDNGEMVDRDPKDPKITRARNKSVAIYFKKGSGPTQVLRYVSANLGPEMQMNPGLLLFLDTMGRLNTFLKATSYMPHRPEFSLIRNTILTRSDLVLQEDTGVPFRYYKAEEWDVHLFGGFSNPIKIFAGYRQADLAKAYAEQGRAKSLPFPIGYGSKSKVSGMQMAVRKTGK